MRRSLFAKLGALIAVLAIVAAACGGETTEGNGDQQDTGDQPEAQSTLDAVVEAGMLRCGVNDTVPGFGFLTADGAVEGFDIDFCKAFAAAVLGTESPEEGTHYELVPVSADERFNALRAGEYDVLVRNTTWTSSRDGTEGMAFAHVNFYDGQAMMVKTDSGFEAVEDMDGATVCVTSGTTTELNLADYFQSLGIENTPLTFEDNTQIQEAFVADQCQGWTSDRSQLAGIRSTFPEEEGGPESLVILDDIMSKEPLAPATLDGDSKWHDVIDMVVNGLILAEELGVTQGNVADQASNPDNPGIAGLLGVPFEGGEAIDPGLGVDPEFMQGAIAAVGNYGEIFERHLGTDTPLGLDRGINALWTDGGIQYAVPFR